MATPLSSSASYCTAAEFVKRYDLRQIGDLIGDDDTRVDGCNIATHPNVLAALEDASGEVEMACLVGKRYVPTDLNTLTGMSKRRLQKLVSDLAMWCLMCRRYPAMEPTTTYSGAVALLQQLREGVRIFGLEETADAGLPKHKFVDLQEIETLNLGTHQARRFFGVRAKEARLGA